ncbi:30S ribosomal protein S11 [Patescibacteria group bacterium]|nr:30S ribosomal protein S11 [Patescibacteria group bacterium]MBU1870647.1 30S ribosomal protein S11 [Patescibacteria group bacterium]
MIKEEKKQQQDDVIDEKSIDEKSSIEEDKPGLEELPEEVRKKLEKSKTEKKEGSSGKWKGKKKKKNEKQVNVGIAYIKATYNNTMVTLTDLNGNVLSWASAGMAGFKGPKKSTSYAAQIIVRIAIEKAKKYGLTEVSAMISGVGTGRESAIRALNVNGLVVTSIKDITPIPHNGCRPKKPRRI